MLKPQIVNQPTTHNAIQLGIAKFANAIKPTLGPLPNSLIHIQDNKLEFLEDGGTIARRILQLDNRTEDVGAMLLRQVLWQVNQQVGDGTATTAVLYEAIYNEGLRYITAGSNPMQLRDHLVSALPQLTEMLTSESQMLTDVTSLQHIAHSVCHDRELADALGEVMDTIGQYGRLDIRSGNGRGIDYSFVEGTHIKGGVQSKEMLKKSKRMVAELYNASVLITDIDVNEPQELVGLMQLVMRLNIENLLLVVNKISDLALSLFNKIQIANRVNVVVVKIDGHFKDDLVQARQDMTMMLGGRAVLAAAGQTLDHVQEDDFGSARWVWGNQNNFGFAGGGGDPVKLRNHIQDLRKAYHNTTDKDAKSRFLKRLGRLYGGSATLHVGGVTDDEIQLRKDAAERTAQALRHAIAGGVIGGGGTSMLRCQDVLKDAAKKATTLEERAAYEILAIAVEAPIRSLLANAGYDPSEILAQLEYLDACNGFNVLTQQYVNVMEDGIFDVAYVQTEALRRAVLGASQALTIDVMILHSNPEVTVEP